MTRYVDIPSFHPGQLAAFESRTNLHALCCGRRWGKTDYASILTCDSAIKAQSIGIFAPDYKILSETYTGIADILEPVIKSSSKVAGVIRTTAIKGAPRGGRVDFWSLDNERAGRSRKYHGIIIDEAAFTKANMMGIWEKSIKPTLIDYGGWALVASTPAGVDPDNFFYNVCTDPKYGFTVYHAPTSDNPYLPRAELADLEKNNHPLVYRQEYLAQFVDWSGVQFFALSDLLVNDQPVEYPSKCDYVFAVIDTAVKTGKENDGTGVSYWAGSKYSGHRLICLDWDIIQIEGSLLEVWLPSVYQNLERLARETGARQGSLGAWIEDKASGTILLQQAGRRLDMPAYPIESKLTAMGKDERAISVSGYVYQKHVKVSRPAFDKVVTYKEQSRNHFIHQIVSFKIGDKDVRRQDDLLDTFCYAVAIALGDYQGF